MNEMNWINWNELIELNELECFKHMKPNIQSQHNNYVIFWMLTFQYNWEFCTFILMLILLFILTLNEVVLNELNKGIIMWMNWIIKVTFEWNELNKLEWIDWTAWIGMFQTKETQYKSQHNNYVIFLMSTL